MMLGISQLDFLYKTMLILEMYMLAHLCTEHSNTPSVCIVVNQKMHCDRYSNKQRRVKHKTT